MISETAAREHPLRWVDMNAKKGTQDLKGKNTRECNFCEGDGVTHLPLDYPCLEVRQFCQDCETGRSRAARLAEIVSVTLRRERVRAA
jgi:hypothetical protein